MTNTLLPLPQHQQQFAFLTAFIIMQSVRTRGGAERKSDIAARGLAPRDCFAAAAGVIFCGPENFGFDTRCIVRTLYFYVDGWGENDVGRTDDKGLRWLWFFLLWRRRFYEQIVLRGHRKSYI